MVVSCFAAACVPDPKPCEPSLHEDEVYMVEIVSTSPDPVDAVSGGNDVPPSCALDDIKVGDRYSIPLHDRVYESRGGGAQCYHFECPLDVPSKGITWSGGQSYASASYLCLGTGALQQLSPSCKLTRFTAVYSPWELDLEGTSSSDPLLFVRALTNHADECPDVGNRYPGRELPQRVVCADQYRVKISKQTP